MGMASQLPNLTKTKKNEEN